MTKEETGECDRQNYYSWSDQEILVFTLVQ